MDEKQKKRHLMIVWVGIGIMVFGFLCAHGQYQKYAEVYDQPGMVVPKTFLRHRQSNQTLWLFIFLGLVSQLAHVVRPRAYPVVIVKDPKVERLFDEC